ncbi:MAG: DUF1127 domain-containing protein [Parvibaculaceae bacterium]
MREYALATALNQDAAHNFATVRRVFANWLSRRRLRHIDDLDDHILQDIGLNRDDLRAVLRMPLAVDPLQELQRQSRRRPR